MSPVLQQLLGCDGTFRVPQLQVLLTSFLGAHNLALDNIIIDGTNAVMWKLSS